MSEVTAGETVSGYEGDFTVADDLFVSGKVIAGAGIQTMAEARTATADGTGTGQITKGVSFVSITAGGDANAIVTLPSLEARDIGYQLRGRIGATGCELRTPAASGVTINNVDSDGTQEYALPANCTFWAQFVAANTWIVMHWTNLGAVATAVVPD